jgi:hypothetical protein
MFVCPQTPRRTHTRLHARVDPWMTLLEEDIREPLCGGTCQTGVCGQTNLASMGLRYTHGFSLYFTQFSSLKL